MRTIHAIGVGVVAIACVLLPSKAQAAVGFLQGERTEGMSKICFYDVLGETHTLNLSAVSLCPLSQNFDIMPEVPAERGYGSGGSTGYLQGERDQGLSKICYYDVLGETHALTISAVKLCPISHAF